MNQKQIAMLAMSKTAFVHFDSQPSLWNIYPPLADVVNETRAFVDAFAQQGFTQAERVTIGHTSDKETQKKALLQLAFSLIMKIRPYAKKNGINVLLQAVDHSETALSRGAEAEIINRCQIIHDKGVEYLSKLTDHQVTTSGLDALQAAIYTFAPMTSQRNAIGKARTTTTANMETLLKNIRTGFELLDDLVPGLVANPDFVATYQQTRQVKTRNTPKDKTKAPTP
ncbi:MAG: hypothetical protein V4714_06350 [Bacteroidota bacterium]